MREPNKLRRFEQTVLAHLDAACNLARWLTCNEQDTEDIVQRASTSVGARFTVPPLALTPLIASQNVAASCLAATMLGANPGGHNELDPYRLSVPFVQKLDA
ncbi:MAG: hypothetical protein JO202_09045 [Ktedonobacteraceae bacterium]|nr:hypothetical protein [Ktedonobacteraceae bacterium]